MRLLKGSYAFRNTFFHVTVGRCDVALRRNCTVLGVGPCNLISFVRFLMFSLSLRIPAFPTRKVNKEYDDLSKLQVKEKYVESMSYSG